MGQQQPVMVQPAMAMSTATVVGQATQFTAQQVMAQATVVSALS